MKIAFLGTSAFAVPALQALVEAGHDVVAVYTRAPKPAGRGQQERKTPVHELAEGLGLAVRTPASLKSEEEAAAFKVLDLDAAVVVSYGHLLPKSFLEAPVLGCINIHGSLLPRWRGAAPSWPATPRPASPPCAWTRASTPARCSWRSGRRSRPPIRPKAYMTGWPSW